MIRGRPGTLVLFSVDQIELGDRNNAIVSVEGEGVVVQGELEGELAPLAHGDGRVVLMLR